MLMRLGVLTTVLLAVACGSSEAGNPATPTVSEEPSPTKPASIIPSPREAPLFKATTFLSDVVIPSKRGIGLVGWSLDSQHLAYASIDSALNLSPNMELVSMELVSSDLTGTAITDEGLLAMPSFTPGNGSNPQRSAAAAWTRDGFLIKETGEPGAYGVVSTKAGAPIMPSLPLYSIPIDREGRAYLLGPDGSWQRDDGSIIAQLTNPIDEGAFSVSPDGTLATYARDRDDGQRDLVLVDAAGNERIVATAPFVGVDGWKADSSVLALRTGPQTRDTILNTTVTWVVLGTGQTAPVSVARELDGLFIGGVAPSPTDVQTYFVEGAVRGTDVGWLAAWYLTTDGGKTFSRFGLMAGGTAIWSPDGTAIAYTTDPTEDGTGNLQLHIARLR